MIDAGAWGWTGINPKVTGSAYAFWSGIGGKIDVPVLAAIWWWRHTCHVKGCWRFARHPLAGTPYIVCGQHHPNVPDAITPEHVADAHHAARRATRQDSTT